MSNQPYLILQLDILYPPNEKFFIFKYAVKQ